MAKDTLSKSFGVKHIGSNKQTETVVAVPGTTTADVLNKLGLAGGGYQLSDSQNPKKVFKPTDVLYALLEDGSLLHCSALVDAGGGYAVRILEAAVVALILVASALFADQASSIRARAGAIYYGGGDTGTAMTGVKHGPV